MGTVASSQELLNQEPNPSQFFPQGVPRAVRRIGLTMALLSGVVSLTTGYLLVFRYHQLFGDAISRAIVGMYMTWDGHFHLAAMGFYWSPLLSLFSVPFALARHWWPPLMTVGFSANILSALFAGVGVYHLYRILWRFGLSPLASVVWTSLYLFNPLIFLYSANGMSDAIECAILLAMVDGLVEYLQTDRLGALVRSATWLAAAFMVRYESVPIGACLGIALVLSIWFRTKNWYRAEAIGLALLFPIVMAGIIWMLLGAMIMHNPLYFLNSRYSNGAQISTGSYNFPQVLAARHHLGVTLYQVFRFMDNFWAYAPAAVTVAVLQFRRRTDSIGISLLAASFGAPLLQVVLLYSHRSADWQRFFIYYIPFGFLLFAYVIWKLPIRWRSWFAWMGCFALVASNYAALEAMKSPVWGNGDTSVYQAVFDSQRGSLKDNANYMTLEQGEVEAHYINAHPHLVVLISTFDSPLVMPFIRRPGQIIFSGEPSYDSILENPLGRANAILTVPNSPHSLGADTSINRMYPGLWAGHVSWTKLIHQWKNGDRLYAVLKDAP